LRPRFPIKAAPPFSGETIVIGAEKLQQSSKPVLTRELR
jgi:hypothetical protein